MSSSALRSSVVSITRLRGISSSSALSFLLSALSLAWVLTVISPQTYRPLLLLELLSGTYDDPGACAKSICESFGYDAFVVQHGEKLPALPVIATTGFPQFV